MTRLVELYGHADCCLCRTALEVLARLRRELDFELVEHDITADDALHRAYFERVPVVALDGDELFDFRVDEAVLRARLATRVADGHDLESTR
ncbi:MAG: glutaredoxin family protein [Solirubrobacteraceae bacterium]